MGIYTKKIAKKIEKIIMEYTWHLADEWSTIIKANIGIRLPCNDFSNS